MSVDDVIDNVPVFRRQFALSILSFLVVLVLMCFQETIEDALKDINEGLHLIPVLHRHSGNVVLRRKQTERVHAKQLLVHRREKGLRLY